jgi:beta-lactamase superfamily II metal-dependent hydrolase
MSNPKKKPTSRRLKSSAAATGRQIQVRMYNVGFGDCFLMVIPTDEGERRMLVDCGYHSQGKGMFSDVELVNQIKADLNGRPLEVVIATHRHQDHISGFGEKDIWKDIAVEEVWLPFTAEPKAADEDPALKAWNALMEAAHGLCDSLGHLTPGAVAALEARDPDERLAAEFMLWNARANLPGLENLLHDMRRSDGQRAKRRFLPEEKNLYPSQFTSPALPGVTVHVLGPPRDPALRKQLKVPSSWGFDQVRLGPPGDVIDSIFGAEWRVPVDRLPSRRPFTEATLKTIRLFNDDLFFAAKALDGFLNGESLVLVLEVGNARLLLPGDAEVGAWTAILDNADALALASGATFLKVGHHGSHNATPITFINEHLAENTPVVISTQKGPGKYRNGIPLQQLLTTMTARSMPFVRSDTPPAKTQGIFAPGPDGRWVDCYIAC